MKKFATGSFVKNSQNEHVGQVIQMYTYAVKVLDATTGEECFFFDRHNPQQVSRSAYDAQVEARTGEKPKTPEQEQKTPVQTAAPKGKAYLWHCLECGANYNGHECPRCGGEDRIYNTSASAPDLSAHTTTSDVPLYPEEG